MMQPYQIGMLAAIEAGTPRLRPLEFTEVNGELWAGLSRRGHALRDGQAAEVLLLDPADRQWHQHGVIACSDHPEDRLRLWQVQQSILAPWFSGAEDPDLLVVRFTPRDREYPRKAA